MNELKTDSDSFHLSSRDSVAVSGSDVPSDRRLDILRALPEWQAMERADGLWVVVACGGSGTRGRFRSQESAEHAAAKGNVETWLRIAVNVAPESVNQPGHVGYYARMLVDTAGMSKNEAMRQCEQWANDEALFYAIRIKATGAPHAE